MRIAVRNLSFAYAGKTLFDHFSADLDSGENALPLVVLGSSGSGKTTLLKLLAGLLKPLSGEILYQDAGSDRETEIPKTSFMFQESRLLPWYTVLENVSLPLEKVLGREGAREKARYFLSLVFMDGKEGAYPKELSGGQAQRVSMARAFAWPSPVLLMDEPFQSLDIPLRISLMDLTLSLLGKEDLSSKELSTKGRLLVAVTHDPWEAIYMGGRIIVLGGSGEGIVFDRKIRLNPGERMRGTKTAAELEQEIIEVLRSGSASNGI